MVLWVWFQGHTWQMRREPITTPFLPKDSDEDFQESLKLFKLILRFMNDATINSAQEAILADYIIQQVGFLKKGCVTVNKNSRWPLLIVGSEVHTFYCAQPSLQQRKMEN